MFREIGKLKDAEKLLKERRFSDVLTLVRDPEIRDHKRAIEAREAARRGLIDEARSDLAAGRIPAAGQKLQVVMSDGDGAGAAADLDRDVRAAAIRVESEAKSAQRALREAVWHDQHGDRGHARRILEPFQSADVTSFVRRLDETEATELAARDAALAAIADGESPGGLRHRLRELRHAVRDPRMLADVHARALDAAAGRRDASELGALIGDVRGARLSCDEAIERAALALVAAARDQISRGCDPAALAECLRPFPVGSAADADGLRIKLACWAAGRARVMAARGHEELALSLEREAAAAFPDRDFIHSDAPAAAANRIAAIVREVEDLVARGDWDGARARLDVAIRAEPEATTLDDWKDALLASATQGDALLAEGRVALASGDLRRARRAALKIRLARPQWPAAAQLLADVAQKDEDAQKNALDAERAMLRRGSAPPAAASMRFEAVPDFLPAPAIVLPGDAFILRIENEGDWLVHPGQRLTIGNQANGQADLQILAALGAKHATLERSGDAWRIVGGAGQRVAKNGREVAEAALENGDRIQLGHALTFTFHRPNPANATAALRLHGDFSIHGCTRLILFAESGRKGSILLAPGSDGHVPLRSVEARLEIFRTQEGEDAGELFARSPQGVASGDDPERAQVRVRAGQPLSVGPLRVHVDRVRRP